MASVQKSLPAGWRDKLILALTLLLALSPWLLGYTDLSAATWNAVITGGVLAAGAASVLVWEPYWPELITAFAAFWLALSPRIMDFSGRFVPTAIAFAVGAAVAVLALWSTAIRARAQYFAEHPNDKKTDPTLRPPTAPTHPRQAA